jgi:hypothetical protein
MTSSPDSTVDHRPHPLTVDTKRSRTSVITGPSTWVTGSVCCAPQILRGADLLMTFISRSTKHHTSVARLHTLPWVPRSIGRPNLRPQGRHRPWQGRHHRTRSPKGCICAALTTSEADVTVGRAIATRRAAPWAASAPRSPPRWALDDDVDPPNSHIRQWARRPAEIHHP